MRRHSSWTCKRRPAFDVARRVEASGPAPIVLPTCLGVMSDLRRHGRQGSQEAHRHASARYQILRAVEFRRAVPSWCIQEDKLALALQGTSRASLRPLPMLQDWDKLGAREKEAVWRVIPCGHDISVLVIGQVVQEKLESIVNAFARELTRGKAQCKSPGQIRINNPQDALREVFMKLGRNGRLFYRLCGMLGFENILAILCLCACSHQSVEAPWTNSSQRFPCTSRELS